MKEETKVDFSNAKKAADMEEKPWWEKTGEEQEEKEVRIIWKYRNDIHQVKYRYPQNYTAGRKEVPQEQ